MKKLIVILALMIAGLSVSANSVRYFTRSQAARVSKALDAQSELMIYCGYEYELATYVIVNEVWAEPVNSKYYEIWLYGFDAYTGDEIYMPLDLSCVWLYNSYTNRMYSAAQYLRFRSTVATPHFYWTMPPYNPFVRYYHDPHFNHCYTYHYEIHRHGWRPPMNYHGMAPYPPYYMRTPNTPAPVPHKPFTPGVDFPQTPNGHGYLGNNDNGNNRQVRGSVGGNNGGVRTGTNSNNTGNRGTTNRNTNTDPANNRGGNNSAVPGNTRNNNNNANPTNTRNSNNNNATPANTRNSNNNNAVPANTRNNNNNATPANTRNNNNNTTPANTRNNNNNATPANTRNNNNNATPANTRNNNNNSTTTNTRNNNNTTPANSRDANVNRGTSNNRR